MTGLRIAVLYTLFAVLATAANLGAQALVLGSADGRWATWTALLVGTLVGLPVKYVLDKRYIFAFRADDAAHDARLFALYAAMAVVTTVVFWGSELLVGMITGTTAGHLVGGALGLAVGYAAKYRLDKTYVFVAR